MVKLNAIKDLTILLGKNRGFLAINLTGTCFQGFSNDSSQFTGYKRFCQKKIIVPAVAAREKELVAPSIDKKSKFTYSGCVNTYNRVILAGLLVVLLTTLLACSPATGTSTLTTPPATGPQSTTLVNGDISVNAETNMDYAFTVEPTMKDVSVVGSFQTFGGAPNHIEVYVMDDVTYTSWLKRRTVHILFDSGSLSNGSVDQAITAPGKYHLIFTNYAPPSLSPAQQVTVSFDLKWTY